MNGGDAGSYTGVMQQVMVQLGRIEGKMDSFDNRLRAVEEQQAAWRELVKMQEPESERWKRRIERSEQRLGTLEDRRSLGDALKHYWYVGLVLVIPVAVNSAYVVSRLVKGMP